MVNKPLIRHDFLGEGTLGGWLIGYEHTEQWCQVVPIIQPLEVNIHQYILICKYIAIYI